MPEPHKIGIPPGMRVLYIERHEVMTEKSWGKNGIMTSTIKGHYRLWLHTSDRLLGTFLKLYDNGKIERITVRANEGDQIDLIKPED